MRHLVLLAAVLAASPARADAPPVSDWSGKVETVTVMARPPGPLVWRVSRGDSTVALIGVLGPLPKDLAWNDASVSVALKGARELLLQSQASVGLVEGLWFLTWHSNSVYLPGDTPMESTLPVALAKRFQWVREDIKRDADRYGDLRAPLAALRLEGDWLDAHDLARDEPGKSIERLARKLGVRARPVAKYEALPMLRALPAMSARDNEACVRAALDDIDTLKVHAGAAAKAWAEGDLDAIKAHYSEERFERCIQVVPGLADLFARAVKDSVGAVDAALDTPGKSVMLVSIGALLRKDGVLDRLEAQGLAITPP